MRNPLHHFLVILVLGFGLPGIASAADVLPPAGPIFAAAVNDLEGKPMSLTEFKGKVIVLNFWATWCAPCRKEIPALEEGYRKYGPRGVEFIGAAMEDDPAQIKAFASANGITYPLAIVGREKGIALLQALGNRIAGLPYTVVIDRQGVVVGVKRGVLTSQRLQQLLDPAL